MSGKWAYRVVAALRSLGGEATLTDLYAQVRRDTDEKLTRHWHSTVRETLQSYCPESRYFNGKEALFEHKKHGIWALRKIGDRANGEENASRGAAQNPDEVR